MQRDAVRFLVSGLVQGVFFRGWTAEQARGLHLRGWARNLRDGRVEIVAAGEPARIAELAERLWQGPPAARVDGVTSAECTEDSEDIGAGFDVR